MSVYFIRAGRYIKVGYSENPERRFQNLFKSSTRYGRPWDLELNDPRELLAVIDGDLHEERICHAALDDYLSGCEWFIDEPGVREFMGHAQAGRFPHMTRPEGPFERVPHTAMSAERQAEIDRMIDRARRRAS